MAEHRLVEDARKVVAERDLAVAEWRKASAERDAVALLAKELIGQSDVPVFALAFMRAWRQYPECPALARLAICGCGLSLAAHENPPPDHGCSGFHWPKEAHAVAVRVEPSHPFSR